MHTIETVVYLGSLKEASCQTGQLLDKQIGAQGGVREGGKSPIDSSLTLTLTGCDCSTEICGCYADSLGLFNLQSYCSSDSVSTDIM